MALEIQVSVAVVNTEPPIPGNPGVMVRAVRSSTLFNAPEDAPLDAEFAVARHRLKSLVEEVQVDVDGQLQMYESKADA